MRIYSFIVTAALSTLTLASIEFDGSNPTVDLDYAKYSGQYNETSKIYNFFGIHYADSPAGEQRWKAPVPIEQSGRFNGAGILDATTVPKQCPNAGPYGSLDSKDQVCTEDCLILNVQVPSEPVSDSLPVLVSIHGGGYNQLSATRGDGLVYKSNGTVIHVGIQYRLSMLGFLGGDGVKTDGVLNSGLLDQRESLRWIQKHIAKFGGDPNRVTVWGGSAGGGSVTSQLIAYGGDSEENLFHQAIAEYPWWQPFMDEASQKVQYETVLRLSGCEDLNCLRSKSSEEILSIMIDSQEYGYPAPGYGGGVFNYGPVVDGDFIRELPSRAFEQGHFQKVPLITDRETFEGLMFTDLSSSFNTSDEIKDLGYLFPGVTPEFKHKLFELYPESSFLSTSLQRSEWFGDFVINCPSQYMAREMTKHNPNVYKMVFNAGTFVHASTAAFLMCDTIDFPDATNTRDLIDVMTSYWISFVTTGDVNSERSFNAPEWPKYSSDASVLQLYGLTLGFFSDVTADPDVSGKCNFFESNYELIRN